MQLYQPTITGSLLVSGSIVATGGITVSGSIASASYAATASFVTLAQTASFVTTAQSASNAVTAQTASYANSLTVAGTLTAQTLVVQTITSSVDFVTGSTRFGSLLTNTHVFSGSVTMNPGGLFVSSSGLVGIGTSSPSTLLHINGSSATLTIADNTSYAAGVGGKLSLHGNYRSIGDITEGGYIKASKTNSSDGDYGFDMVFATSNYTAGVAERLRISSTGAATFSSTVAATQFTSQGGRGTSYGYKLPDWQIYNTTSGNALAFSNYTSDLLYITSGGNIGIGITNPSRKFQVMEAGTSTSGNVVAVRNDNSTAGAFINFIAGGGNAPAIGAKGNNIVFTADGYSGTELMRILSGGNILINQTSSFTGVPTSVEMSGVGSSTPTLQASYNVFANHGAANTTWRGYYVFHRSRGTTAGSVTAVAAEDYLGTLRWNGTDGTGEIIAAEINAMVDGTVGTNDMPTRLTFSTTADGGSSPTERMRINSAGNVRILNVGSQLQFDTDGSGASTTLGTNGQYDFRIYNGRGGASNIDVSTYEIVFGMNGSTNRYRMGSGAFYPAGDNAYSCGASGQRWTAIWAANGTIQTSDARQKKDITDSNLGLEFINKLRPVSYKWKVGKNVVTVDGERIDENGATQSNDIITPVAGVRTHYGLIAQEVKEVLGDVDFGGYVYDEDTDTMALRYDQFIAPLIKAIQEQQAQIEELKARLT